MVLTYKTYDGKRKTKWQSTGLPIKGNKRRAEAMMRELQDDFEPPVDPNGPPSKAMLFADYLVQWLEIAKSTVKLTTYASYKELSNSRIIPYFRNLGVTLGDLKAVHTGHTEKQKSGLTTRPRHIQPLHCPYQCRG